MTNTAKGIPELDGTTFVKDGPTNINAALVAVDGLLDARATTSLATLTTAPTNNPGSGSTFTSATSSLTVPTSGLVAVFVQADLTASGAPSSAPANIDLYEDSTFLGSVIQSGNSGTHYSCPNTSQEAFFDLFSTVNSLGTPPSLITLGTKIKTGAGWIIFPSTAGSHTYKLGYTTINGASPDAKISNARLWVRVLST